MAKKKDAAEAFKQALRKVALRYPEAEEGIACAGTALESIAFKARKKAFLFVGPKDVKVKLGESLPEAATLASQSPGRYKVGTNGWVTVMYSAGDVPPLDLIERWIEESYRVIVPKAAPAKQPKRGAATRAKKSTR